MSGCRTATEQPSSNTTDATAEAGADTAGWMPSSPDSTTTGYNPTAYNDDHTVETALFFREEGGGGDDRNSAALRDRPTCQGHDGLFWLMAAWRGPSWRGTGAEAAAQAEC